ncbi:phage tail protein [Pyramidobacter sp.]|uniref:TipJ family phage tail tip protein n=1 Tax=Pyramidobacter sp. TaxID=1943581 RepID=UPI0025FA9420|nr:phage tail protein [Pyramidobacter sp.]MCI7402788.1 phage tail protein [Pyramidobacter sp.]MDY3213433.1 phage tail protein [Pyramidobacter sp.]
MRREPNVISGSKGKGGGGGYRAPVEEADSLQAIQYATLLDVVSEGPIVGLVDRDKSIYLNETPLRTSGGTLTLPGVSWQMRIGAPDQSALPYASGSEAETGVGAEVTNLYPKGEGPDSGCYRFSVTNELNTRLRITLGVQGLYKQLTDQDHAGDVVAASVGYRIVITDADNKTIADYSRTLKGKTSSQYLWDMTFSLKGKAPWLVTVYKTSADSSSGALVNNLYLSSYTEIIGYGFTYPNTAVIALKASAESFGGSVPSRVYYVKGLKVQVPSNYDPETRGYSGVWDGTFKLAWTDNPAWIFYDMVVNDRYGVAKYLPQAYLEGHDLCDKWYLYRIAQICDELVPDGLGGEEPRYTFNYQIAGAGEAKEVLQSIASVFHGMTYWGNGLVYARADFNDDPVRTITQANVKDGVIDYASASMQERHSVALVKWNDPSDLGRSHVEAVYDWDAYRKLGYRPIETVAYGCYSRGQAHRHGKWLLASEETQWIATVEMGLDGFDLVPGDIVKIADPAWMGYRASGRVLSLSADRKAVTLDSGFDASSGGDYKISICDTDGTEETRDIAGVSGAVVTVETPFAKTFVDHAVWSIAGASAAARQFRVQSVKETDKATIQVKLLEVNPNKFAWIEQNLRLEEPPSRRPLKGEAAVPENLSVSEYTATVNARLVQKALFSWGYNTANFAVTQYRVRYTDALGGVHYSAWQSENSFELSNVQTGTWNFAVQGRTFDGRVSAWATTTHEMAGISALKPANVGSLRLSEWGYMQKDGVHVSNVDVAWGDPAGMQPEAVAGFEIYCRYGSTAKWQRYGTADADARAHTIENVRTKKTIFVMVKTKSRLDILASGVSASLAIVGKDAPPGTPANFAVRQDEYDRTQLLLSWSAVSEPDIAGYRVYLDSGEALHLTPATAATIPLTSSGEHTLRLVSVDNSGQESVPALASGTYTIVPEDVSGLTATQAAYERTTVVLTWNAVPGRDIEGYEVREGASWDDGTVVTARAPNTRLELRIETERTYTWWVAAHTAGGTMSQSPQSVTGVFELNPSAPSGLVVTQDAYDSKRLAISWTPSPDLDVVSYEVRDGMTWASAAPLGVTADPRLTVTMPASHEYNILVRAKNKAGLESETVSSFYKAKLEPQNVTGFQAVQDGDGVDLWWNAVPSSGVDWYEIREGFNWTSGALIASGVSTTSLSVPVAFERGYHYMVKAHSRAGYYSDHPASAPLVIGNLSPKNVFVERDYIALLEDGTASHSDTRWTENPCTWATVGGRWSDYPDKRWLDFGGQYVLSLAAGKTSGIWYSKTVFLGRTVRVKISADFQTLNSAAAAARLQYRSCNEENGADAYGPWTDFREHTETLSKIQFRVVMTTASAAYPPYVTLLHVVVDMPDVVKSGRISVPASGATIDYGFEYAITPTVVVSADTATARAVIEGVPGTTSCTVKVLDTSNTAVAGTVNWNSYGY